LSNPFVPTGVILLQTHIELVVSAGFVLFFDFVAGPFPAIGEVEFSLL
jgi:hypothetical protein